MAGQKKKLTLQRSSSFKDFMKPKPSSPVVAEPDGNLDEIAGQEDSGKSKSGKWRKIITRTMTRKTSKMVQKALAEEDMDSGDECPMSPMSNDFSPDLTPGQRTSVCSSGSGDTLHSPISKQLSGCGDRQSLDSGYSQRDSVRLDDYSGPFCGRARVHTDFTPSPYDIESLKLQKGDIIDIIEKPPVGTWTGKLNGKVGSFKFIYVTILPEEIAPAKRKRFSSQDRRSKPKPKTLEEVLERIGLTELGSLLSMHGFQSLEDFGSLKEYHLNELNITDSEHRTSILTAVELINDSEDEEEEMEKLEEQTEEKTEEKPEAPRDSGCFESTENLDNGRDNPDTEVPHGMSQDSETLPGRDITEVQEQLQDLDLNGGS